MSYHIYNEDGEKMRVVGRQEEAQAICAMRRGWTFKRVMQKIIKRDGYSESIYLGEALI